jgi:adenine phosphoribosyltransferase
MKGTPLDLKSILRQVPDFPKPGINFIDITPLLANPKAMAEAVDLLVEPYRDQGIEQVVGVESRGFIFGSLVAQKLDAGFVPIRKPGKLPAETVRRDYELEYGSAAIEMHADAFAEGTRVLMMDDLLATGGTMAAACELVSDRGGRIVGIAFLIELDFLHGRDKLSGYDLHTVLHFDG